MATFSIEQRAYVIEAYFRTGMKDDDGNWNYSIAECEEEFSLRFPDYVITEYFRRNVINLVHKFRTTACTERKKSVRRPTMVTEDAVEDARGRMQRSPSKSVKKLAAEIGVSYGSAHKILRKKLEMFPYKVCVVHELKVPDYRARLQYCHWFQQHMTNDILNLTFYTDEAWFHLSGYVNSQNYRIWSTDNPHEFLETPLHPQKIGVWAAMSRRRIIGPVFFDGTVNATVYREQLLQQFFEEVHDDELQEGYFQQDGATAHTARRTIHFLEEFYQTRLISRGLWPPRSPDLSPLDYFLWGYCKTAVFAKHPTTIEELKNYIKETMNSITENVLQNVFDNMHKRIEACIVMNGNHFQQFV